MAWVRVDDQVPRHEKFLQAGPAASWLWLCGLAHCQAQLTDGFISDQALPFLGVRQGYAKLAGWLVQARLWERVEGGYHVHDYLVHNAPRAVALPKREAMIKKRREAGRAGGIASGRRRAPEANAKQSASTVAEANAKQSAPSKDEAPSHPIPSHASLPKEPEAKRRARDSGASYADDRLRIPDWLDADLARMHPSYDRMGFYLRLSQSLGDEPQDQSDPRLFALWVKQRFCAETGIPPPEVQAKKALSARRLDSTLISWHRLQTLAQEEFKAHGCPHDPACDSRGRCLDRLMAEFKSGERQAS